MQKANISTIVLKFPGVRLYQLQHWNGAWGKLIIKEYEVMDENCGQVIWRVILPPGEDFWRMGPASGGVKIQHVNTGKFLSVTKWVKSLPSCEIRAISSSNFLGSHRYPEPWGEGMREVVASKDDAFSSLWTINFYQLPDMGQDTHHAKADSVAHIYVQRRSYPPRLKRSSIKEEHRISRLQLLRFVEENYPQEIKEIYKVNRCLARYSPRATTTNRPTNRALNKPALLGPNWPKM